jgi:heme exporter protein D
MGEYTMEVLVGSISAFIALVALVISTVVARRQTTLTREQTEIQKRLASIEEARRTEEVAARGQATVIASFEDNYDSRGNRQPDFTLTNLGPAPARQVDVELVALDDGNVPTTWGLTESLPIDVLQPGQQMKFPTMVHGGLADTLRATVGWTDEAGPHEAPYILRL